MNLVLCHVRLLKPSLIQCIIMQSQQFLLPKMSCVFSDSPEAPNTAGVLLHEHAQNARSEWQNLSALTHKIVVGMTMLKALKEFI